MSGKLYLNKSGRRLVCFLFKVKKNDHYIIILSIIISSAKNTNCPFTEEVKTSSFFSSARVFCCILICNVSLCTCPVLQSAAHRAKKGASCSAVDKHQCGCHFGESKCNPTSEYHTLCQLLVTKVPLFRPCP